MSVYYNEWEPYVAQWLRNLIAAGHLPEGDVDERSITDVRPDDLKGYAQCHFFAGIGGWPLALRLAGWGDRPVWTGSCPCQPFSVVGKQKAQKDDRHLWPHWFRLITEVHPPIVFGEQVAGAIAHSWLDDAFDDLEGEGYETGAAVLPACSVGAPHKRDRLWFVANSPQQCIDGSRNAGTERRDEYSNGSEAVADTDDTRPQEWFGGIMPECAGEQLARARDTPTERYANWDSESGILRVANGIPARVGKLRALGNAIVPQVAAEFIKAVMKEIP